MLKNGFYNIVGTAIRIGITSLTIPLFIRMLGIEEYGLWTLLYSIIDISSLAHGGFSTATTFFLSKDIAKKDDSSICQTLTVTTAAMLILSSAIGLFLWIFSSQIIDLFPKLDTAQVSIAKSAIQLGGIIIWARLLQEIPRGIGQAYEKYGLLNILGLLQAVVSNLGMISIILFGGKTLALIKWQALVSLLLLVINALIFLSFLKEIKLRLEWNKIKAFKIAKYSIAVWLTAIGGTLFQRGDRLIIGSILGTEILGIYSGITSITTQVHTFSSVAMQPILPRISNLLEGEKKEKLIKQIKQAFLANCAVVIILGSLLLVSARLILEFVFSASNTEEYILIFRVTTIIYSCFALNAVGHYTLQGVGKANELFLIVLLSSIVSVIMIYYGAFYLGLWGAVLGNAGYILILFSNFRVAKILKIFS